MHDNTNANRTFRGLFGIASRYVTGIGLTPNQYLEIKRIARKRNNVTKKGINEVRVEKGAKRAQRCYVGDFSGPR